LAARTYGQYDGVTTAVELIAERWALLIVRDLLVGPRRFTDLRVGLPRIPTNILTARLKELQEGGVVRRVPLMHCGLVYELTPYGRQLEPIVLALGRWGFQALGEPGDDDVMTADALTVMLHTAFQPGELPLDVEVRVGAVALRVQTDAGELRVFNLSPAAPPVGGVLPPGEPELVFTADAGIRHVIAGTMSATEAMDAGILTVVSGEATLLERFAAVFSISSLEVAS